MITNHIGEFKLSFKEEKMQLYSILNKLLSLINIYSENKNIKNIFYKTISYKNNEIKNLAFTISDKQQFDKYINDIFLLLHKKLILPKQQ